MKKYPCFFAVLFHFCIGAAQSLTFSSAAFNNSPQGYYFLSTKANRMILDEKGVLVYYAPSGPFGVIFNLLPNGLMACSQPPQFYFLDSTFKIVDSLACKNKVITDPHELLAMANGHFLLLGTDSFRMDLSKYFWKGRYGSDTTHVQCVVIQELDHERNVIFEWRGKDHFAFDDVDTFYLQGPLAVDMTHSNALEMDIDGNILLCSRNLNEITKINRKNGAVIWRFGGKRNQFKFVNCPVPFYGQHDVRRIANGHITLFDNGYNYVAHASRALEFELDEKNMVADLKWSWTPDSTLFSNARGNVQRIGNDNTLVSYGENNRKAGFSVIDKNGVALLKVDSLAPYRVVYYSALPWSLPRPQINCFDSIGRLYLDAGPGYNHYSWNTGDTMQVIPVKTAGYYSVFVPCGEDGYIGSEKMMIANPAMACKDLAITAKKRTQKNKSK